MPNTNFQQTPYLQSGLPQIENRPPDGYSGGQLGIRFTFKDPQDSNIAKRYQLVQADSVMDGGALADGQVAYWLANSGYLVTTDVSLAGRGNIAGIIRGTPTLGYVHCIQIGGRSLVQFGAGPTAAPSADGLIVIPDATDGQADSLAAGSAATYPPLGVTVGVVDGSNQALVELNITGRE